MKKCFLPLLLTMCTWHVCAQNIVPHDVRRFVEQRTLCDHFRGEEPYDAERKKFLETRIRKHCAGTDRRLSALKSKYKSNSQVLSKLNEFEAEIEGASH